MNNNLNFAIIPMKTNGNRLDVENIFSIAAMFYQNITVCGWEKWGSNEPFSPFESLFQSNTAYQWKLEMDPKRPIVTPEGYETDIRWMPEYFLSDENYAFMQWDEGYATKWSPAIVGINQKDSKLLIWDSTKKIWAEFMIECASNSRAFYQFIHAWMDW